MNSGPLSDLRYSGLDRFSLEEAAAAVLRGILGGWYGYGFRGPPSYGPPAYGIGPAMSHATGVDYDIVDSLLRALALHSARPESLPGYISFILPPWGTIDVGSGEGPLQLSLYGYTVGYVGITVAAGGGAILPDSERETVNWRLVRVR